MAEANVQRRKFPRLQVENPVHVKRLGPEGLEGFAKTESIGLGGCMFVNHESVGSGTPVELLIKVRPQHVITATGRIVYEVPKADRTFEVGVEFLSISEKDREVLQSLFESGSATP